MMVCVGNICRSPIADAYLKTRCPEINVFSSGLGALVGKPADNKSVELMKIRGIDISSHRAQQINSALVAKSDLILTMQQEHVDFIHERFPSSMGKVYLIGKWLNNREIMDPFGGDIADFKKSSEIIFAGIDSWVKKIK